MLVKKAMTGAAFKSSLWARPHTTLSSTYYGYLYDPSLLQPGNKPFCKAGREIFFCPSSIFSVLIKFAFEQSEQDCCNTHYFPMTWSPSARPVSSSLVNTSDCIFHSTHKWNTNSPTFTSFPELLALCYPPTWNSVAPSSSSTLLAPHHSWFSSNVTYTNQQLPPYHNSRLLTIMALLLSDAICISEPTTVSVREQEPMTICRIDILLKYMVSFHSLPYLVSKNFLFKKIQHNFILKNK